MPKRLPPNNRPWPHNLLYDFNLPETVSPAEAEAFIDGLPTSDRNKAFLRLRYREGRTYHEIADEYKLTATGVRLAVKAMWEKFSPDPAAPAPSATLVTAVDDVAPQSEDTQSIASASVEDAAPPAKDEQSSAARPLSINLSALRRFLGLTAEEFARRIHIENGEALITRLETGFSRPSATVLDLICDAWGVSRAYLLTGQGDMFEIERDYCTSLVRLLKAYLSVATFDRKGKQYWKGSLVDDLGRLINTSKLDAPGMCRVVRVLYDYVDVEQFEALLERMGRA